MTFAELVYNVIVPFVDSSVIPLLYVLAFIFFLIGLVRMFFSQEFNIFTGVTTDLYESRTQGRVFALWGVIALVLIFSLWGILRLFLGILSTGQV